MNISMYDVVYLISNVFMTYIIYRFIGIFYLERKTKRFIEIGCYGIYFLAISLIYLFIRVPIILMISNLVLIFLLTQLYEIKLKKGLLIAVLIYTTLMCAEMVIVLLTSFLRLDLLTASQYQSIFGVITIKIFSYVLVLIIKNCKNIKNGVLIPVTYWLCIMIIPSGTVFLLLTIFMTYHSSFLIVFLSIIFVLLINVMTFYLYDNVSEFLVHKMERRLAEQQSRYYENQLELMKTSLTTTKTLRHDLKNHIYSLYELAKGDKKEKLLEHFVELIDVCSDVEEYACSGNLSIDSIINFKLQHAREHNIIVTVDINIPTSLDIPSYDIAIILGNLMDNSLNALYKLEKDRLFKLIIKHTKGRLIIKICNTFDGYVEKKSESIITTNKDVDNHGLGLESTKKVLEKYNGVMEIEYDKKVFYTTLFMYVE